LRGQRPGGDVVDRLPRMAERDLGVEERVDDPVELDEPASGLEPTQVAAEGDEPDAIAASRIAVGERGGRAYRLVERARRTVAHLREAVHEENDVDVPLRVLLVHPELAAPRARAPVDPPDAVAEGERPEVGELQSLALGARELVARVELRLGRAEQAPERLTGGIDLHRHRRADPGAAREQAEGVAGADGQVAD